MCLVPTCVRVNKEVGFHIVLVSRVGVSMKVSSE